jgi:ABC-type phosphate transport system auxiliary subunit
MPDFEHNRRANDPPAEREMLEKLMCRFWDVTYQSDGGHWTDFRVIRTELETMRLERRKRQERAGALGLEILKWAAAATLGMLAANIKNILAFFAGKSP